MSYTIHCYGDPGAMLGLGRVAQAAREALGRKLARDGRFVVELSEPQWRDRSRWMPEGYSFELSSVRLAHRRRGETSKMLRPGDWQKLHALVNDLLDWLQVSADAWTGAPTDGTLLSTGRKLWVRKYNCRRVRYTVRERTVPGVREPMRVLDAGSAGEFECGRAA